MRFYKQLKELHFNTEINLSQFTSPKDTIWKTDRVNLEHSYIHQLNSNKLIRIKSNDPDFEPIDVIEIYTDGACRKNGDANALGAYAYRLIYKGNVKDFTEAVPNTTNNRMELTAVITAFKALKKKNIPTIVYSDSQYITNGATKWLQDWKKKNYKNIKNAELWKELDSLINTFEAPIYFLHINSHIGIYDNEAVDNLCNQAMNYYKGE